MAWYDLDEKKSMPDDKIINDNIRFDKFMIKNKIVIESIEAICFSLPKGNEQIRIITQKRFNAFALVKWLVDNLEEIEQIFLTSYRVDEMTLNGITEILNEREVKKLTIMCSAFFTSVKKKEPSAERLKYLANTDSRIKAIFCHNHTKIIGIKTKDTAYVIEGSGNLTGNARIEQYMIENSNEIFEFHKKWIDELVEKPKEVQIYGN